MRFNILILLFVIGTAIQGCTYKSKKILFKTAKEITTSQENPVVLFNEQEYEIKHHCLEGDVLYIRLLNESEEKNSYDKLASKKDDAKFTVHNGEITIPIVGKVKVLGLSREEIVQKLMGEYSKYIIEPIIDVEFASLTINVFGEVMNPGKYPIVEDMHLIDGIGLAGGFSAYGIYKNVRIIRGKGESQEIIVVDVTNIKSLNHEKLVLKDDDIIYIEPRGVKQFDTAVRPYLFLTSILSSAAAIFIVLSRTN